jgi:periplasmic protein TonB
VGLLDRSNSGQAIFAAAVAMSLAAHLWAVAWLMRSRSGDLGSVDVATSAISVNLETTDVIDSIEAAAAKEAASSPAGAPVDAAKQKLEKPDRVKDEELTPLTKTEVEKTQDEERTRLAAQAEADRQRIENEAEVQKKVKEAAEREETKHRAEEKSPARQIADTEEIEKKKREKAQQAAVFGGAGTTGATETQASQGRVSASQGSILNYGASLRALISSNTPRDIRKTSLRLAFSISPSGGLAAVDVIKPSSDPEVDRRMVDLVRSLSLRFPPPPSGASANQLSYNIEIIFR